MSYATSARRVSRSVVVPSRLCTVPAPGDRLVVALDDADELKGYTISHPLGMASKTLLGGWELAYYEDWEFHARLYGEGRLLNQKDLPCRLFEAIAMACSWPVMSRMGLGR